MKIVTFVRETKEDKKPLTSTTMTINVRHYVMEVIVLAKLVRKDDEEGGNDDIVF